MISITATIFLYRLSVSTLCGVNKEPILWKKPFKDSRVINLSVVILVIAVIGSAFLNISLRGINISPSISLDISYEELYRKWENDGLWNVPERMRMPPDEFRMLKSNKWIADIFKFVGIRSYADLIEEDVSEKPPNWSGRGDDAEIRLVKGARLKGRNLNFCLAADAFLINADLREAKLRRAFLEGASLQGANLEGANLEGAILYSADLKGASLKEALLKKANLSFANLSLTSFEKADLSYAMFSGTNFKGANLSGTNIQDADLEGAKNLEEPQIRSAKNWVFAYYDNDILNKLKLPSKHNERLVNRDFSGYDFSWADLEGADLEGANLREANLQWADLSGANFRGAILERTDLRGADLWGVMNLTIAQLSNVKSLYKAKLHSLLEKQIREKFPHLLEKPKDEEK